MVTAICRESPLERNSGWLAATPKVNRPLSCLNDRGAARARSTRAQTNQSCLPFPSPLLFSVSPLQSQYSLVPSRHYKPNGRTDALCIFTTAASSSPSPNAISPASACNHRLLAQQDLTQIYMCLIWFMITRYVTKQRLLTKTEDFLGPPCFASFVPYRLLYGRRDGRTKKRDCGLRTRRTAALW